MLGHINGIYNYYLDAEPYTRNQYEFPGYTIIKAHEIAPAQNVLPLIQPKLAALEGKTDREKVLAFNDYLCDLLDYGKENKGSLQDIFTPTQLRSMGSVPTTVRPLPFCAGRPISLVS